MKYEVKQPIDGVVVVDFVIPNPAFGKSSDPVAHDDVVSACCAGDDATDESMGREMRALESGILFASVVDRFGSVAAFVEAAHRRFGEKSTASVDQRRALHVQGTFAVVDGAVELPDGARVLKVGSAS